MEALSSRSEARGLAVRRPDAVDRRAHAVELTDAGRAVYAEATAIAERTTATLLAGFSAEEQETLCALPARFAAADGADLR